MSKELMEKAARIIAGEAAHTAAQGAAPYCVLSVIDQEGYPTSSAITAAKTGGLEWMTFCTGLSSNKARRIADCKRASVCFAREDYNITLVGDIEIVTDPGVKEEMWYPGMAQHFSGPDHPDYCVLRFTTRRYNLLVDWQEAEGVLAGE